MSLLFPLLPIKPPRLTYGLYSDDLNLILTFSWRTPNAGYGWIKFP